MPHGNTTKAKPPPPVAVALATGEGLTAHARSAAARLTDGE
jgi:histidinol dehydrogenase